MDSSYLLKMTVHLDGDSHAPRLRRRPMGGLRGVTNLSTRGRVDLEFATAHPDMKHESSVCSKQDREGEKSRGKDRERGSGSVNLFSLSSCFWSFRTEGRTLSQRSFSGRGSSGKEGWD